MSRRTKILTITGATLLALALAAFGGWWFLLRSDAPAPVSLDEAVESLSTTIATTTTNAGVATSAATTTTATGDPLAGTWVVGDGSFAGYRVEEELANIGFTTAAGRTDRITGSLVIGAGVVTSVEVTADLTALVSDSDRRDQAIRTQALETRDFPTATFSLTAPLTLPAGAGEGTAFSIPATGDLTIHGVTNRVTIELEAQLVDDRIVVVGSTPVLFSDYDMDLPRAVIVLSVADNGIMEFQLVFGRP